MPSSPARKSTSRAATPSWLGEPRSRRPRIAASAARALLVGWARRCSSSQRALICSISHGPRARTCGTLSARLRCGCSTWLLSGGHAGSIDSLPMDRRRKHWGWGYEDQQPPARSAARPRRRTLCEQLGIELGEVEQPVALEQLRLAAPRVPIPARAAPPSAPPTPTRARSHALGKSYLDVVRGFRGHFEHPPDFVARPRDEIELEAVLEWCSAERRGGDPVRRRHLRRRRRHAATSATRYNGAVSIDLGALDRVLEVDEVSRVGADRGGRAPGPGSRSSSRERDLTLRHFPQSFEYSTLGGWIATRAGGPLRDAVDAHRGLRRVGARDHPGRACGSRGGCPARAPASAPTGCSPGSEGALGGDHPRRGCGSSRGPRTARSRGRALRELRRRRGGRARDLPGGPASRPTAGCSTPARPA